MIKTNKIAKVSALTVMVTLAGCAAHSQGSNLAADVAKAKIASQEFILAPSRLVGVEIVSGKATTSGGGVWLGNGEILTATHIFLSAKSASDPIFITWHGEKVKAAVVFHGMPPNDDLVLLKIDPASVPPSLAKVSAPQVCDDVEPVGAQLYVTAHDGIYSTYASPVGTSMYKGKKWSDSTTAVFSHGVSGSPVYDSEAGCLAGIVSRVQFQFSGDINDPKQAACEKAALQIADTGQGVTCAVEPKSIFMASDVIATFLKNAQDYERTQGGK